MEAERRHVLLLPVSLIAVLIKMNIRFVVSFVCWLQPNAVYNNMMIETDRKLKKDDGNETTAAAAARATTILVIIIKNVMYLVTMYRQIAFFFSFLFFFIIPYEREFVYNIYTILGRFFAVLHQHFK